MAVSTVKKSKESIALLVTIPFASSDAKFRKDYPKLSEKFGFVATKEPLKIFDTERQSIIFSS